MLPVTVRALGVGALEMKLGEKRILVDAINSEIDTGPLAPGDLLLFTHDDGDHFCIGKFPDVKGMDVQIIGPPSVVMPLLAQDRAAHGQIVVLYAKNNKLPPCFEQDGIRITSYASPHFMDWKPVHNSYLIEYGEQRIYITGDSLLTKNVIGPEAGIDTVICNLVDEGFITKKDDPRHAIHHHLSCMLRIMSDYALKRIIGVHLISFPGTVDARDMKKLVEAYGFENILIPVTADEVIIL